MNTTTPATTTPTTTPEAPDTAAVSAVLAAAELHTAATALTAVAGVDHARTVRAAGELLAELSRVAGDGALPPAAAIARLAGTVADRHSLPVSRILRAAAAAAAAGGSTAGAAPLGWQLFDLACAAASAARTAPPELREVAARTALAAVAALRTPGRCWMP